MDVEEVLGRLSLIDVTVIRGGVDGSSRVVVIFGIIRIRSDFEIGVHRSISKTVQRTGVEFRL
jgi:hypothetical protein